MIVDFTIANFRSIQKRQTLSFFAESTSKHLAANIAYPGNGKVGVLRTAGIYGANASGKSNILLAFQALRYIVCHSGDLKDGDTIPCYEPFLLSPESKSTPVEFEIEFFVNGTRYLYHVSFDSERIVSESLDFYPSRSKANLFRRGTSDTWDTIAFGAHYKGGKRKYAFFKNNSYLSKAGNNADSPPLVRSIFNYFWQGMIPPGISEQIRVTDWKDDNELVRAVSSILSKVDTGIQKIHFKEQDISDFDFPSDMPESIKRLILASEKKRPLFLHRALEDIEIAFTEDMESTGTMKLFNMIPVLLKIFNDGGILLQDELDNSFHPHIAELVIQLFNDPVVNKNHAQLIFSTHNITLMSPEILRRDQIWLTEKSSHGDTQLVSLDDFDKTSLKMDSPFSKWYDEGRLGAIPKIDIAGISKLISDRVSRNA